jgi:hypothetical protein
MRGKAEMTVPEVAKVLGTRAALGIGFGLLLANCFTEQQRRAIGGTLLVVGAFSGAVLASELFGKPRSFTMSFGSERNGNRSASEPDNRLSRETTLAGD